MAFRAAFPDIRFAVSDLVGETAQVAARWSLSGTQTGPFKGQPPSGVKVHLPGNRERLADYIPAKLACGVYPNWGRRHPCRPRGGVR